MNSANDECIIVRDPHCRDRLIAATCGNDKGNGGGVNTDVDDEVEVDGEEDDDDQIFAALVIYDTITNPEILPQERKMSVERGSKSSWPSDAYVH